MKLALSIFGVPDANSPMTSVSSILEQSALSTLLIGKIMCIICYIELSQLLLSLYIHAGFDDIRSARKMEELAVGFFNGFAFQTVTRGAITPRTTVLVTSNQAFTETPRYTAKIMLLL